MYIIHTFRYSRTFSATFQRLFWWFTHCCRAQNFDEKIYALFGAIFCDWKQTPQTFSPLECMIVIHRPPCLNIAILKNIVSSLWIPFTTLGLVGFIQQCDSPGWGCPPGPQGGFSHKHWNPVSPSCAGPGFWLKTKCTRHQIQQIPKLWSKRGRTWAQVCAGGQMFGWRQGKVQSQPGRICQVSTTCQTNNNNSLHNLPNK